MLTSLFSLFYVTGVMSQVFTLRMSAPAPVRGDNPIIKTWGASSKQPLDLRMLRFKRSTE